MAIFGAALWLWFINKKYNFVKSPDYTLPSLFMVMASANPLSSGLLSTSTLLLYFWLLAFTILFGCYRQRNATQEVFVVATFLSLGSMIDLAFLLMIPFAFIAAVMLKAMGWKEFLAFGMGLVAPYWVGFGFGWIKPEALHWFRVHTLFSTPAFTPELIAVAGGIGVFWLCSAMGALGSAVKLYAGNPTPRTQNYTIYLLSVYCLGCMIVNAPQFADYCGVLCLCMAVMFSNTLILNNISRIPLWIWIIALLNVGYLAMIALI